MKVPQDGLFCRMKKGFPMLNGQVTREPGLAASAALGTRCQSRLAVPDGNPAKT